MCYTSSAKPSFLKGFSAKYVCFLPNLNNALQCPVIIENVVEISCKSSKFQIYHVKPVKSKKTKTND